MADLFIPDILPAEYNQDVMQQQLEKIQIAFAELTSPFLYLVPQNVEPDKTFDGLIAFADGTNWDPGHGKGLYEYKNTEWHPLFNPLQGIITSTTTVVNTTTETTIFSTTISAAALHTGDISQLQLGGSYDTNAASDTWTLRIKIGGTTIHTITRQSGNNVTDAGWFLDFFMSIRSEGASGTLVDLAILADDDTSIAVSDAATHMIDTTADNDLVVTVQWGAANANNSFRSSHGILEHKH